MLINVIVELLISCYFDADKLFVDCVGNLVSMLVEDLYDTVPLVKVLFWTKPAKVIAASYALVHLKKSLRSHGVFL